MTEEEWLRIQLKDKGIVQCQVLPIVSDFLDKYGYDWSITSFTKEVLLISLKFDYPEYISVNPDLDKLIIEIQDGVEVFQTEDFEFYGGIFIVDDIPPQTASDA